MKNSLHDLYLLFAERTRHVSGKLYAVGLRAVVCLSTKISTRTCFSARMVPTSEPVGLIGERKR